MKEDEDFKSLIFYFIGIIGGILIGIPLGCLIEMYLI